MNEVGTGRTDLAGFGTFFFKYPFTILWIAGFGYGAVRMLIDPASVIMRGGAPATREMGVLFVVMWIVGTSFALWTAVPLKGVELTNEGLFITNYVRDVFVPFAQVAEVRARVGLKPSTVVIVVSPPTRLGSTFTFIPTNRRVDSNGELSVVAELRLRAAGAKAAIRQPHTA